MLLQMERFHSSLWLSNSPLDIHIDHIFFIHSSINATLGGFHILAIGNNAAINMGCICIFKLMKQKCFCTEKETINNKKRQPTE